MAEPSVQGCIHSVFRKGTYSRPYSCTAKLAFGPFSGSRFWACSR